MSQAPAPPQPPAPPNPGPTQQATPSQQPKQEPVRAKDLAAKSAAKFPAMKLDYARETRLKMTAPKEDIMAVATFVRDELGFERISAVAGVDWIAKNELEVVYFVGSERPGFEDFIVALAERLARDNPVAPSLIEVWPGAEYHERETHEMFGINFMGHPNQGHLLLPEDWNDLPPLRKDYMSPGR